MLTVLFDSKLSILHLYSCFWAGLYIAANPFWRLKIEGREKIKEGVAYVIISNHQSFIDILALFSLYKHFKWVSKTEIFKIPIIGWNMSLNGYISIDRDNSVSFLKLARVAGKYLNNGSSVMIFPEGTRSTTNQLRQFKEGAFRLAILNKKPILPIVLNGTAEILPKKSFLLGKSSAISIRVLDPIPYEEFSHLEIGDIIKKIRNLMVEAHFSLRENSAGQ